MEEIPIKREDLIAYFRFQIITAMLDAQPGFIEATAKKLAKQQFNDTVNKRMVTFSERTIFKYYSDYRLRKKEEQRSDEDKTETINFSNIKRKKFNKKWARLIQKVYNVDPLICPKCSGKMKIISFIEEEPLIKKILKHLKLWVVHNEYTINKSPPQDILNIINNIPIESSSRDSSMGTYTNTTSFNPSSQYNVSFSQECDYIPQMPFEDEYSQLVPYND